jgi:hypothetical protein
LPGAPTREGDVQRKVAAVEPAVVAALRVSVLHREASALRALWRRDGADDPP